MSGPPQAHRGDVAGDILRFLKPARVLDTGGQLAALLRAQGIAADDSPAAGAVYNLAVAMEPPAGPERIRALAAAANTLLFPAPDALAAQTVERLLACGFRPDFSWQGRGALFRRAAAPETAGLAGLYTEILRLRARVAELDALEHRMAWLEVVVDRLRRELDALLQSRAWRLLTRAGGLLLALRGRSRSAVSSACGAPDAAHYQRWIAEYEPPPSAPPLHGPRFAVLLPGGDAATLASLQAQSYPHWETAADLAPSSAECLLWPAPGDTFAPGALAAFAHAFAAGADLVYSDEDSSDTQGLRSAPLFKPDWDPDLLLSQNYIGRAFAVRRDLAEAAGGPGDDGLYGLLLRLSRRAADIVHIPQVLYHARGPRPPASREGLAAFLHGTGASVEEGLVPGSWRVRYPLPPGLAVEIIVPSRNAALLERCLASVAATAGSVAYTVTVIDNSTAGELAAIARRHGARYVDWTGRPFNFSAMNNRAAETSSAPLLLFLNDDTTATAAGWLAALAELATRPEVGAVGARLLYPEGRIQHAGVAIGIYGVCGHVFKGCPAGTPTPLDLAASIRNVSAVTGACLMVPTGIFREVSGFDEVLFPVAYNDIDLCLRIRRTGRRVLYTPFATLCHHEALSKPARRRHPDPAEIHAFQARWQDVIARDPFYNPNLTRTAEDGSLGSYPWER